MLLFSSFCNILQQYKLSYRNEFLIKLYGRKTNRKVNMCTLQSCTFEKKYYIYSYVTTTRKKSKIAKNNYNMNARVKKKIGHQGKIYFIDSTKKKCS